MATTANSQLGSLPRCAAADHTDTDPQYFADQAAEHGTDDLDYCQHGVIRRTCRKCLNAGRPRARYIHADDGLANEYATSAIQVAAGLLASQYHQAKDWAGGDESSVWAYLPDTWISSAAGVLAAVCRG